MSKPDFNLLFALDALLAEGSVARAADRLRLSRSAMSRTLTRLRETTGDPLLVRAGRGLVPTPRAIELREQVARLVGDVETVLRPVEALDLQKLDRTFTFRAREGFVEAFGPALIARIEKEAPHVRLHFIPKPDRESTPLRDGTVDLETGVVGKMTGPEVRAQALFRDRFVGVARIGHPLSRHATTAAAYAQFRHIGISRRGPHKGPVDDALERLGLERDFATIVGDFSAALALAGSTDLIATVPQAYTSTLSPELFRFTLPFPLPEFTISLLWHPRLDADPAHRWLRRRVREACAAVRRDQTPTV